MVGVEGFLEVVTTVGLVGLLVTTTTGFSVVVVAGFSYCLHD